MNGANAFNIICTSVSAAAIVFITGTGVAMTQPTDAEVQVRIVNGSDGKVSARAATDSAGRPSSPTRPPR